MVKLLDPPKYGNNTKSALVSLFADTKQEVQDGMVIEGLDSSVTLEAGSSVITASKQVAFLKSDGQWQW